MKNDFPMDRYKAQYTLVLGIKIDLSIDMPAERWENQRKIEAETTAMELTNARVDELLKLRGMK